MEPRHLYIFTYVVVGMRGASDISVTTEPMDRSDMTRKRVFRKINHSRKCGSALKHPRVHCGDLEAFARVSRIGREPFMASTHDGNPISNTLHFGFNCRTSMAT